MSINITPEITEAYRAFLDEPVDAFFDGAPIMRRDTYPYRTNENCELIGFAAGFQAARKKQEGADGAREVQP